MVLLLTLLFTTCFSYQKDSTGVYEVLGSQDFTKFNKDFAERLRVIFFYAESDGRSSRFGSEFVKAVAELTSVDPSIVFAQIDSESEQNDKVKPRVDFEKAPHVIVYKAKLKNFQIYDGELNSEELIPYLKARIYKCPFFNNIESFNRTLQGDWATEGAIFGIFGKGDGDADVFDKFVRNNQEQFTFGYTWNADDFKTLYPFKGKNAVVLIRPTLTCFPNEQCYHIITSVTTIHALRHYVLTNLSPQIGLFKPTTAEIFDPKPTHAAMILFFDFDYKTDRAAARDTIRQFRDIIDDRMQTAEVHFAVGTLKENAEYLKSQQLPADKMSLLLRNMDKNFKKVENELLEDGRLDKEKVLDLLRENQDMVDRKQAEKERRDDL